MAVKTLLAATLTLLSFGVVIAAAQEQSLPQKAQAIIATPQAQQRESAGPQWDKKLEARSRQIFPFMNQESDRLQWLQEQENEKADRQRGNSYTIRVR
jgi:hypothetical protein